VHWNVLRTPTKVSSGWALATALEAALKTLGSTVVPAFQGVPLEDFHLRVPTDLEY